MNQNQLLQDLEREIQAEEDQFIFWKSHPKMDSENLKMVTAGFKVLDEIKYFLKNTKVYIQIKGTISAGKSTFINSLLGQQLLPSQNDECTKKSIFIQNGETLKIEGKEFNNLKEASEHLTKLWSNQKKTIEIETPSLFHKELQRELRDRVIIVDTSPGYVSGYNQSGSPFENPECAQNYDQTINLWLNDYAAFAEQKSKIFKQIQEKPKNTEKAIKMEKIHCSFQNQFSFWFVMNKFDERNESEDQNSSKISNEVLNQIETEFFKISALNALQYRIMNLADEMAQKEFLRKFFIDNKKKQKLKDEKACKFYCENMFIGYDELINDEDQEYQKLLNKLINEINDKIKNYFSDKFNEFKSYDFFLKIQTASDLKISKCPEGQICSQRILKELRSLQQFNERKNLEVNSLVQNLIEKQIKGFSISQKESTIDLLRKLCSEILCFLETYHEEIKQQYQIFQKEIFYQLSLLKISDSEKQTLLQTCSFLFEKYSDIQNNVVQIKSNQITEKCYFDIVGIKIVKVPYQQISLITSSLVAASLGVAGIEVTTTASCLAVFSLTVLASAAAFASSGLAIYAICRYGMQAYENSKAQKNLKVLQIELGKNIQFWGQQYEDIRSNIEKSLCCITRALL